MTRAGLIKEEFYIRRRFDDEAPVFVDATRSVHLDVPYVLTSKRSLKATCAVRTDDEVVAFSLRNYTGRQAEREVENIETTEADTVSSTNLLKPRMPRKTLYDLNDLARALAGLLGDNLIAEVNDQLFVLSLARGENGEGVLRLTAKLAATKNGYERHEVEGDDAEFELPIVGVRLRIFARSPVRERLLAYAYHGYLTRRPGELETVTRAIALALNSLLGLATFKMLFGLDRLHVPVLPPSIATRPRPPEERVQFLIPVLLFTDEGAPAARGEVTAEVDLDRVDPVTGAFRIDITLGEDNALEWNPSTTDPDMPPADRLGAYERTLADTAAAVVYSALGEETARDIAYDIMLSDLNEQSVATLRAAVQSFPTLAAKPGEAEVRVAQPA